MPRSHQVEIDAQMAGGLRSFEWEVSDAWFQLMSDRIVKPTLESELARSGAAGIEMLDAIEAALGRSLR
jgi:hypothetical protein